MATVRITLDWHFFTPNYPYLWNGWSWSIQIWYTGWLYNSKYQPMDDKYLDRRRGVSRDPFL